MIKLASWNVNSLKVRLPQVIAWLKASEVDVLALQETKLTDDFFPENVFNELGYHVVFSGQKTYNGVAIISRFPMADVITDIPGLDDVQRRILAVTISDWRLINLYVPNGSEVGSEKFNYKLSWLEQVKLYLQEQIKQFPKLTVVGDFNIAPEDIDVHDPKAWEGCVHVSPEERASFSEWFALGLNDSFRQLNSGEQQFSWWDYRTRAFRRNRGLRIDHILLSKPLLACCQQSGIDIEPRRNDRPSDHAPVWVELDVNKD